MSTFAKTCISEEEILPSGFAEFYDLENKLFLHKKHIIDYRDNSGVYTYVFLNETNIKDDIETDIGYYDTTGTIIYFDFTNGTDVELKLEDIDFISNKKNDQLPKNLVAIEFRSNIYFPSHDVFLTYEKVSI